MTVVRRPPRLSHNDLPAPLVWPISAADRLTLRRKQFLLEITAAFQHPASAVKVAALPAPLRYAPAGDRGPLRARLLPVGTKGVPDFTPRLRRVEQRAWVQAVPLFPVIALSTSKDSLARSLRTSVTISSRLFPLFFAQAWKYSIRSIGSRNWYNASCVTTHFSYPRPSRAVQCQAVRGGTPPGDGARPVNLILYSVAQAVSCRRRRRRYGRD